MSGISVISSLLVCFVTYAAAVSWGGLNSDAVVVLAVAVAFCACVMTEGIVKRGGMLRMLFGLYFIIGYIFPGMLHAASGNFPYFRIAYDKDTVFTASLIVAAFTGSVFVGMMVAKLLPRVSQNQVVSIGPIRLMRVWVIIGLCTTAMFLVLLVGPSVFVRRRSDEVMVSISSFEALIISIAVARSLPVVAMAASLHRGRLDGWSLGNVLLLALSLVCVGITNFPLAVSRFMLIGVVFTLLHFILDVSQPRFKALFSGGIAVGIVTVFPLLSFLQRGPEGTTFEVDVLSYLATAVDLDGFQSTANIVLLVGWTGVRWGWQLLSSLLFFVPRSMWSGKGMPSGAEGADYVGYPFNNISAPLPSEFYIDFGFTGCIVGGMLVGYLITRIDDGFAGHRFDLRYYLLVGGAVGYMVILLRGPLLGVIAPVVAQFSLAFISTITPFLFTPRCPTRRRADHRFDSIPYKGGSAPRLPRAPQA